MAERARAMIVAETGTGPESVLTGRNRRTALILVAWIIVLVLVSCGVAWLRN